MQQRVAILMLLLLCLGTGPSSAEAQRPSNLRVDTVEKFVCTTGIKSESIDRRRYGYCANAYGLQFNMPMSAFQPHFKFEDVRMVEYFKVFYCYQWKRGESSWSLICRFEARRSHEI